MWWAIFNQTREKWERMDDPQQAAAAGATRQRRRAPQALHSRRLKNFRSLGFGTRWAKKVMPMDLQKLMRHDSIETTMRYYVDLDADEMAEELWKAEPKVINTFINNPSPEGKKTEREPDHGSAGTPLSD